jgi:hypothetical protein
MLAAFSVPLLGSLWIPLCIPFVGLGFSPAIVLRGEENGLTAYRGKQAVATITRHDPIPAAVELPCPENSLRYVGLFRPNYGPPSAQRYETVSSLVPFDEEDHIIFKHLKLGRTSCQNTHKQRFASAFTRKLATNQFSTSTAWRKIRIKRKPWLKKSILDAKSA